MERVGMVLARWAMVAGLGVAVVDAGCGGGEPDPDGSVGRDAPSGRDTPRPASCMGTATPCDLLSGASCAATDGCYPDGDCMGVSRSCSAYTSSGACYGQLGCSWSSSTSRCNGSAWSCSTTSAESNCDSIDGCYWLDGCTGFASCILQDTETQCGAVLGCRWE